MWLARLRQMLIGRAVNFSREVQVEAPVPPDWLMISGEMTHMSDVSPFDAGMRYLGLLIQVVIRVT